MYVCVVVVCNLFECQRQAHTLVLQVSLCYCFCRHQHRWCPRQRCHVVGTATHCCCYGWSPRLRCKNIKHKFQLDTYTNTNVFCWCANVPELP